MFDIYANGKSIYQPMDRQRRIMQPKLTLEMGKAGSLQFIVPPTNIYYDTFEPFATIVTVELDEVEIFRGRVLNNSVNFQKMRTVYCEGNLSYLVDSVQKNERFEGKVHDLFAQLIANHNARMGDESGKQFVVGNVTVDDRDVIISGQTKDTESAETKEFNADQIIINATTNEWATTLDYITNNVLSYTGGYLRTRHENGVDYIDLVKDYGRTATQGIRFGRNLLDFTQNLSVDELFTVLIPLGDENLTIEKVNGGSDELVDAERVARYGRIVKTHAFESVRDPNTLLENAQRYLATNGKSDITIEAKAVDLHFLDKNTIGIFLGDKVQIDSMPHGLLDTMTCMKIEYDMENPANNTYTFGTPKQSLTERYRKDKQKSGGGGGGGGAATDEVEGELKKDRDEWEYWIKGDPKTGDVTLGSLHKQYKHDKEVLEKKTGLDLKSDEGYSLFTALQDTNNDLISARSELSAKIDTDHTAVTQLVTAVGDNSKGIDSLRSGFALFEQKIEEDGTSITTIQSDIVNIIGDINTLTARMVAVEKLTAQIVDSDLFAGRSVLASEINATSSIASLGLVQGATVKSTGTMIMEGNKTVASQDWVDKTYATKTSLQWEISKALTEISHYPTVAWIRDNFAPLGHEHKEYAASNHSHTWNSITGKPNFFPPTAHSHTVSFAKGWFTHSHTTNYGSTSPNGLSATDKKTTSTTGGNNPDANE